MRELVIDMRALFAVVDFVVNFVAVVLAVTEAVPDLLQLRLTPLPLPPLLPLFARVVVFLFLGGLPLVACVCYQRAALETRRNCRRLLIGFVSRSFLQSRS